MEPRVNQDETSGASGGRMIAVALVDCKGVLRLIVAARHTKIVVERRFDRSVMCCYGGSQPGGGGVERRPGK